MGVSATPGLRNGDHLTASDKPSMRRIPALDGVRALAILGVFLFHLSARALPGGFTGVDVFFVLSGFLIASVILHDLRNTRFSMREFYLRRIQRLLPNAAVMATFTAVAATFILLPSEAHTTAQNALYALFEASNFFILRHFGGYWGDSASSALLLHTWSLAVEEQFYIFFPVTLLLLVRRARPAVPLALLACVSFLLCVATVRNHPAGAFYMLPTRAWEPLMGAVLAAYLVPASKTRPLRTFPVSAAFAGIGWAGIAAICASFFVVPEAHFPGYWALLPAGGSLCVLISIVAAHPFGPGRLLAATPFTLIGRMSYSIYLWHWPLILLGRKYSLLHGHTAREGAAIGALISLGMATAAYVAIEQPLRKRGAGRRTRLIVLTAAFSICACACATLAFKRVVADPYHLFDQPRSSAMLYDVVGWDRRAFADSTRFYDFALPPNIPVAANLWDKGGIIHQWGPGNPRVVVFGSSHGLMYAPVIDSICRELHLPVAFFTADGASVFFPTGPGLSFTTQAAADSFDRARLQYLSQWRPDILIVADRWDGRADSPADLAVQMTGFLRIVAPKVAHVILTAQPPVLDSAGAVNAREFVTRAYRENGSLQDGSLPTIWPDDSESFRRTTIQAFESVAREFPNVSVIRTDEPFYKPDGSIRYAEGRKFLYADGDHLTDDGAEMDREIFFRAIAAPGK